MKHVITYPGFAEAANAKGLFTDIEAEYAPEYTFHILPFYEELENGDRLVHSIREHAKVIQDYMDSLDGEVTMIAKCGGTRPTITMDDEHIDRLEKLCLINPPWKVSNRFLEYQLRGWGGMERPDGSWAIPRGDTSNYVVSKEYMTDASTTDMMGRFREIAGSRATDLYIIRSLNDEVFPPIRTETITGATVIDIENGNHHLTGEHRAKVIGALAANGIL